MKENNDTTAAINYISKDDTNNRNNNNASIRETHESKDSFLLKLEDRLKQILKPEEIEMLCSSIFRVTIRI